MSEWEQACDRIATGGATLLSLWGERHGNNTRRVHLALLENDAIGHLALDCPELRYPSLGRRHPPAIRLERAARVLYELQPVGLPDTREWLDHGADPTAYRFLPVEGDNLHQVPVGPVHAGIIEPGHFRFTCDGETVVRLEARLGYAHRGIDRLMQGADLASAARLAGRISGDSTVAYALAFAHAVEQASGCVPPPRAVLLRAVMAEMERVANHLGDVGAICNDASFGLMLAHCAILRERVLRAAAACFGHRLMMDCVVPGGVAGDLPPEGPALLRGLYREVRDRFAPLVTLYDLTASLQDRTVGTGILRPALARQFGAGGYIGRASGRDFDARRAPGYAPYESFSFAVPVRTDGDVNARVWIRIKEIQQSLALIERLLGALPEGPICAETIPAAGEGLALVEGFRGDVLVWLRLDGDRVASCHARDPSWFQWPLLEAAIEGNIIADFPLCNKSFNCSYAGHDL
jgi:Ni,Fe-hydrogenase III large subunit